MARYGSTTTSNSNIGNRMIEFRKTHGLTQADLAVRYHVSGPAIFKFEKGFVTPSLKLWQTIAADMGISEKEAVLMWVKEKLPSRHHSLIETVPELDVDTLRDELVEKSKESDPSKSIRDAVMGNPEVSPSLKKFVSDKEAWEIFHPTSTEIVFLAELDKVYPLISVRQFREAMLVAREIQSR
jgi:DNA-binding XRE family transcriptional regulator